jgi:hypothetical protein
MSVREVAAHPSIELIELIELMRGERVVLLQLGIVNLNNLLRANKSYTWRQSR